ncbi:phage baseplate protein [Fusobacterium ulcerans]|uniref:phage baseplate protein n=1 Tax=Fusobacterium ulcerans TaxID=861 RepID=UPI0030AAEA50
MNLIPDIHQLERLKDSIKDIRKPEDLTKIVQGGKDVVENYIYDLKGIPAEIERWGNVLEDITGLSINTDFPAVAENIYFQQAKEGITKCLGSAGDKLNKLLKKNSTLDVVPQALFYIGDIPVDYVTELSLSHSTEAISQAIVSAKSNIDRINEDAENKNDTFYAQIYLQGDNRVDRYKAINTLRINKALNKIVFNEVYEQMLITNIDISPDSSNTIILNISFEKVFIATLQKTEASLTNTVKGTGNKGKQGTRPLVTKNIEKLGMYKDGLEGIE